MRLHKIILFVLLLFVLADCHKQEIAAVGKPIDEHKVQQWLHKYGGMYADETIKIQTATGAVYTGKLNWNYAKQYGWRGNDYLDVPFVFNNSKSVPRNAGAAEASFVLTVRKINNDDFEAAIRTETHSPDLLQEKGLPDFRKKSLLIQSYTTLNGTKANAWISDNSYNAPEPVIVQEADSRINAAVRSMGASATSAKIRGVLMSSSVSGSNSANISNANASTGSAADNTSEDMQVDPQKTLPDGCGFAVTITDYSFDCIYASEADRKSMTVTCVWIPMVATMGGGGCFVTIMPPGGIWYGNTSNNGKDGSGRYGNDNDPYPPAPGDDDGILGGDPCAKAGEQAIKIKQALNDPAVNEKMNELQEDFKNSKVEHGFAIYKKEDGSYGVTETFPGDANHVDWNLDANLDIVSLVHIHPPGTSAVASPTDIFGLSNHTNADYAGTVIISGDDRYMISITDANKYNTFVNKKDKYYDANTESQWKEGSKILKSYQNFIDNSKGVYTQGTDLMFPTQLYLMKDFNMGVSFLQWDANGNINPIETDVQYRNTNTGSSVSLNGGGQIITSPYQSIDIKNGCNDQLQKK